MHNPTLKTLWYQVLQILACLVASALAQAPGSITVIQHKSNSAVYDWLIVIATGLGFLLLILLLLTELWRCCKLDRARRNVRRKMHTPGATFADVRPASGKRGGPRARGDEDAELQRALALSRATAAQEEEERQLRLAIDASLGYSNNVPKRAPAVIAPAAVPPAVSSMYPTALDASYAVDIDPPSNDQSYSRISVEYGYNPYAAGRYPSAPDYGYDPSAPPAYASPRPAQPVPKPRPRPRP